MISLMLDEPVTPSMCEALHFANVDVYHVRDRGLQGSQDYHLWKRAISEDRALVTVNRDDFHELASREKTHPGVVVIPPYRKRDEQLDYVTSAIVWALQRNAILPSFRDYFVQVADDLSVQARVVIAPDGSRLAFRRPVA